MAIQQTCASGWHWDSNVMRCVKDTTPIRDRVTKVATGNSVIPIGNAPVGKFIDSPLDKNGNAVSPTTTGTRATGTSATPTKNTFETIVGGVGGQKLPSVDASGKSGETYRYSSFEFGGNVYKYDDTGNLVVTGKAAETSPNVVGIEDSGRRFKIGEASTRSGGMQILSAADKKAQQQGLRDSFAASTAPLAATYVDAKGNTVEMKDAKGNPVTLSGTGLTGKQKLADYTKAGLMPEFQGVGTYANKQQTAFNASARNVPSMNDLVNVDFVKNSGVLDNPPPQGDNEDASAYQIRKLTWENNQIKNLHNTSRATTEKANLARAVKEIPKMIRGEVGIKTLGQIKGEYKNNAEFNGKYDSLKQAYKDTRMAKAMADIETKKQRV